MKKKRQRFMKSIVSVAGGVLALVLMNGMHVNAQEATVQNGDIQAALDLAKDSAESLTVTIPAGSYELSNYLFVYPNTTINAEGASITYSQGLASILNQKEGYTASNITINGGTWNVSNNSVLSFKASENVSLNNMTMNSNAGYVVILENVKNAVIDNCNVSGGTAANYRIISCEGALLQGGSSTGGAQPLYIESSNGLTVKNCNFGGNQVNGFEIGGGTNVTLDGVTGLSYVYINKTSTNTTIANCSFSGNTTPAGTIAVYADSAVIRGNTINGGQGDGIRLEEAVGALVENNTISDVNIGIEVVRGGNHNIKNNNVKNCGTMGARFEGDTNSVFEGNTLDNLAITQGANGEGVVVDSSSNGTIIRNNSVTNTKSYTANVGNGIIVNRSMNITVEGNTVANSGNHGIQSSYQSSNITISNNKVSSSGRMGISVSRGAQGTLSGNTVTQSAVSGIVFDGKEGRVSGSIDNCIVDGCSSTGVVLENADVTVNGTTVKNCVSLGITATGSSLTIENSKIYLDSFDGQGVGISVPNGSLNANGNIIGNFGACGIYVGPEASVSATGNQVNFPSEHQEAYTIDGSTSNITTNSLIITSIAETSAAAASYQAGTEAGAVLNGLQKVAAVTGDNGVFTVNYSNTAAENVILYTKDAYGNAICVNAPASFDLNSVGSSQNNQNREQVEAFVNRIYTVALGRDADADGLEDWTNRLLSGQASGAEVAQGFFFSAEFTSKKYSDNDYVDLLYRTMFDREGDADGKAGWLTRLSQGFSREYVYRGFAESAEFQNLCDKFGIIRGSVTLGQARDQNIGVTEFVSRIYFVALNRETLDADGMNDWCGQILNGNSPANVVWGFIFSQEFTNRGLSDDEFVKTMYRTYFGREADDEGYQKWMNTLQSGGSREDVVNGFSGSQEFFNLVESFGLSN